MTVLTGIKRALSGYEIETGRRLRSLGISADDMRSLVTEFGPELKMRFDRMRGPSFGGVLVDDCLVFAEEER